MQRAVGGCSDVGSVAYRSLGCCGQSLTSQAEEVAKLGSAGRGETSDSRVLRRHFFFLSRTSLRSQTLSTSHVGGSPAVVGWTQGCNEICAIAVWVFLQMRAWRFVKGPRREHRPRSLRSGQHDSHALFFQDLDRTGRTTARTVTKAKIPRKLDATWLDAVRQTSNFLCFAYPVLSRPWVWGKGLASKARWC